MNDNRLKIFVSAYACEPGLGSEIGVGWHWVLEMSKYFELWVLTRESNRHTIEPWVAEHPEYGGIHFLYFDLPKWARFWKKGLRGVRTYYNIWQTLTDRIVHRTMKENGIRIFHHLTYGNVLWKVSAYGQRQFFVWGPVGGLETIPEEYSRHYDGKSQMIERIRRTAAALARCNVGLRRRCKHADLILCKTEITRQALPGAARSKAILFTDVATDVRGAAEQPAGSPEASSHGARTEFITVGRMDAWRGFDLVVEAVARAAKEGKDVHLTIVGGGKGLTRLQNQIKELNIEHLITLTGRVEMEEYQRRMKGADVVVNPALKEGAVTVSFDAMAMGKPLICIDTTGFTRYFDESFSIVVPRTDRNTVISNLAKAMIELTDRNKIQKMGSLAQIAASKISWHKHGEEIRDVITNAYLQYERNR